MLAEAEATCHVTHTIVVCVCVSSCRLGPCASSGRARLVAMAALWPRSVPVSSLWGARLRSLALEEIHGVGSASASTHVLVNHTASPKHPSRSCISCSAPAHHAWALPTWRAPKSERRGTKRHRRFRAQVASFPSMTKLGRGRHQ